MNKHVHNIPGKASFKPIISIQWRFSIQFMLPREAIHCSSKGCHDLTIVTMNHLIKISLSDCRVRFIFIVTFRYFMQRFNFPQSYSSRYLPMSSWKLRDFEYICKLGWIKRTDAPPYDGPLPLNPMVMVWHHLHPSLWIGGIMLELSQWLPIIWGSYLDMFRADVDTIWGVSAKIIPDNKMKTWYQRTGVKM